MASHTSNRKHRLAKFVSNVTVVPIPLGIIHLLIWRRLAEAGPVPPEFFAYSAVIFVVPTLAVGLLILGRKKFKLKDIAFSDFQFSDRRERRPAIIMFIAGALGSIPFAQADPSGILSRYSLALSALIGALYSITYATEYKVSLHTAGWGAALGIAIVTSSDGAHRSAVWLALALLCILLGVFTARLVCRLEGANPDEGHLPGEVFVGAVLGAAISVTAFMI